MPHAVELHSGAPSWVAEGRQPPYIAYTLRRLEMLRGLGITPVVVLDGARLPAKAATHAARSKAKAAALALAAAATDATQRAKYLSQTVAVTPEMTAELIVALRREQVEFVVAPYEADAQLAHLAAVPPAAGGVSAVITEDSDLVVLGCPTVLFKLQE